MDLRPRVLSVCSGIGGLDLGLRMALPGARTLCYVEGEAFCCELLAEKMQAGELDSAPIWTDLRTFDGRPWRGAVDLVMGGIPCQPHSVAGSQLRSADERDLIDEFARVVGEVEPDLALVENVAGFVAWNGLGRLVGELSALGYDARWVALRAADVGAPHERLRVFVLAYRDAALRLEPGRRTGEGGPGAAEPRGEREGMVDPRRPRLEDRRQAEPARWPLPWPPGPGGDWSSIPEWCWPAVDDATLQRRREGRPQSELGRGGPAAMRAGRDGKAAAEPGLRRVDDGPPSRVDRLRALGNAVVPQQAAAAILELLERSGLKQPPPGTP